MHAGVGSRGRRGSPGPDGKDQRRGMEPIQEVLVTGGAGYVGTNLVVRLLGLGSRVRVLDLYWFGDHVLDSVKDHPNLTQIKGDLCDQHLVRNCVRGCGAVIQLASCPTRSATRAITTSRRFSRPRSPEGVSR